METGDETAKRTYDTIMTELNTTFNDLIDKSRKDSAPLDLTRSGALLPDFENFLAYLEGVRTEIEGLEQSDKFRDELMSVLESRKKTTEEYRNILRDAEKRKTEDQEHV